MPLHKKQLGPQNDTTEKGRYLSEGPFREDVLRRQMTRTDVPYMIHVRHFRPCGHSDKYLPQDDTIEKWRDSSEGPFREDIRRRQMKWTDVPYMIHVRHFRRCGIRTDLFLSRPCRLTKGIRRYSAIGHPTGVESY